MNETSFNHPTFIDQKIHQQFLDEGFTYQHEENIACKDGIYKHGKYGKMLNLSICEKTARIGFGVISGIICCIPVFCCSKINSKEDSCLDSWAETLFTGPIDGNYFKRMLFKRRRID